MPYKRNYRKKPYPKRKTVNKMRPSKRLTKVVKKVINDDLETKYITTFASGQSITFYNTTTYYLSTFNLMPQVTQGVGPNQRIGNAITTKNVTVRYRCYIPQGANATEPLQLRVMVGHLKSYPATNPSNIASVYSDLYRIGGGSAGPQNNDLDLMAQVNKQAWSIVYDKTHKVGQNGSQTGNPQTQNNDYSISVMGRINLTRHFGKLLYNDAATNYPTNKNWFLWIVPVRTGGQGGASGGTVQAQISYDSQFSYIDA